MGNPLPTLLRFGHSADGSGRRNHPLQTVDRPVAAGTLHALAPGAMLLSPRTVGVVALLAAGAVGTGLHATAPSTPEAAEHSMKQFLAQDDEPPSYRATRRLEAKGGGMNGW